MDILCCNGNNSRLKMPFKRQNVIFIRTNVINLCAKFALHPPHMAFEKKVLNIFFNMFCLRVGQVVFPGYSRFAPLTDWLASI